MTAIALFLYNRPEHTRAVVDALLDNTGAAESDLHVFCDAAKNTGDAAAVSAVRAYASTIRGFRSVNVTQALSNQGVARSIIAGVSSVFDHHDRAIIVEDDVVLSPSGLEYFNTMLAHFKGQPRVAAISGFAHPQRDIPIPPAFPYDVYFTPRLNCWGWATWRDRWRSVVWDNADADAAAGFNGGGNDLPALWRRQQSGEIDSWALRWDLHQFQRDLVTAHPRVSYVRNIGFDGSGTHATINTAPPSPLSTATEWRLPNAVALDRRIVWAHKDYYDRLSSNSRFDRLLSPAAWWSRFARRYY